MYYQGTSDNNIQADQHHANIQTLYLMNPNSYIQGYTDTQQQQQQQLLFLNSSPAGNALNPANIPHAPLQQAQQQHFVGVPLPAVSLHDQNHHGLIQRLWNNQSTGSHHESHMIPSSTVVSATSCGGTTTDLASQLGFQRPVVVSPPQHRLQQQGGLSLSLSPQQQQQISFNNISSSSPRSNNVIRRSLDGASSMILGSKYLKAAQELLDELVNIVGKGTKGYDQKKGENSMNKESMPLASDVNTSSGGGESSSRQKNEVAVEFTTAQRQELQMKKAKLITMLEEVEQRYRQYHHQMQIIVSSFEQVAGIGSAKSYTQLALHAISKQFRCLKDAIAGQIKATSKSLGEEEGLGGKIEGSRLKFVDHHLRQQRALQQLGMMQPNAWRPQRGLPERAVSVLRAWLFEHFLHPYPKDSDKIMLAKQTGLTRSQVSNWFINARVRLWKPMVEEMYLEEVKNQEQNGTTSGENKNKNKNEPSKENNIVSKSNAVQEKQPITSSLLQDGTIPTEISTSTISTSPTAGASLQAQAHNFSFLGSFNMENNTTTADHIENKAKKPRNDMQKYSPSSILSSVDMEAKARESSNKGFNNPLMAAFTMGDFGRFDPHEQMATNFHGNGVSLTLGLPPSENLAMPVSQQNYLSDQTIEMGSRPEMGNHYNRMSYENIDFQSGNKRFPTQLLPDFVTGNLGT
ncbi:BEL1-like homeodomain protein 1 [Lycium ferocissimum]|uniref:BEL1-like homeodomain protein 1 n=1 Tax=Lycium ferocissimum TaxID=112874 RepID=UPI0028158E9C|nr:BEL1-like homeodomain protein 1 [Lycium ferocissimum]XP_059300326.1 BEL1-like homeodomain protein 1 [Lycium ferocissimum]